MSDSYKLAKEAFVANNAGTSVSTINIVSLAGLTSYGLYSTVARSKNGQGVSLLMDFAISVVPLFLGQTVFARTPIRFNLALAMTALIVWAVYKPPKDQPKTGHVQGVSAKSGTDGPGKRFPPRSFLSVYRAQMMLMTVIAILAVDFPIFPRSFGKCEDWGTSLMDIGVGSFVFSLGLANASSWLRNGINRQDRTLASQGDSFARTMVTSLRKTLPVLALGVVRVLMVKGVEYPEHVTEYGVHWNFFFTLALMPFFGAVLSCMTPWVGHLGQAILMCSFTGLTLHMGLQDWVMSPDRTGLLGMNKEGIVSLSGYTAIYLFGLHLGHYIIPPDPLITFQGHQQRGSNDTRPKRVSSRTRSENQVLLCQILLGYTVVFWAVLMCLLYAGSDVSRRLANPAYVIWTAAYNTSFIAGYLVIEMAVFGSSGDENQSAVSPLLGALNKNGLVVFLAANLLTGLINMTTQTMYASNVKAVCILSGYLAALSSLAWLLRKRRFMI